MIMNTIRLIIPFFFILFFTCGCSTQEDFSNLLLDAGPQESIQKVNEIPRQIQVSNRNHPPVEIFVTEWCPHCKRLERFLQSNNIEFTKYDVERDTVGQSKLSAIGGRGVPVVTVGDEVVMGFNEPRLKQLLGLDGSQQNSLGSRTQAL